MPTAVFNGVELYYETTGEGEPMVLVHGGMGSHHVWDAAVPRLTGSFRVLSYDRRGHGQSELPGDQMSVHDHVNDLAALIEEIDLAPAWVAGNSSGASVVLRLAGERPDLFRGAIVHEPALFGLLAGDPAAAPLQEQATKQIGAVMERITSGDHAGAAEAFCEAMVGLGTWEPLPPRLKEAMIHNAPNFIKDDVQVTTCDAERVATFPHPTLLTAGDQSPPRYAPVVEKVAGILPAVEVVTIPGTGHIPQVTHPDEYAQAVIAFTSKHAA